MHKRITSCASRNVSADQTRKQPSCLSPGLNLQFISSRRMLQIFLPMLILLVAVLPVSAQSGMHFDDFHPKLTPYFADELIGDVERSMPKGSTYRIWGWDVGDFSGDGNNDCAMTVRLDGDRRRQVTIYFFVDIEGFLTLVGQTDRTFVDVPLEAGVSIRDNACYVTEKQRQYVWDIRGYRFEKGALSVLDDFSTGRKGRRTLETYRNYQTLMGFERWLDTRSGEELERSDYLSIPTYRRGRTVYQGFKTDLESRSVQFVPKGAFYWKGEDDASFRLRTAYNDSYLYFMISVRDDKVVSDNGLHYVWDGVEIWLDPFRTRGNSEESGGAASGGSIDSAAAGILSLSVNPGNFAEDPPEFSIASSDGLLSSQNAALADVRLRARLTDEGYQVKIRVPFQLLGYAAAPLEAESITELGCSILVLDVDNGFRRDEVTWITTSGLETLDPATYGTLLLIPDSQTYGEASNIYADAIAERLNALGF